MADTGVVNAVIVIAALGVLLYAAWSYSNAGRKERFGPEAAVAGGVAMPRDPASEAYKPVDFQTSANKSAPEDCFPRDRLSAEDLLPRDAANSKWAQVNPAGQGDIGDQNYLSAGMLSGVDTIGASLRNANLQLRSEPLNPRVRVSVWNESTIESDLNRRPLEIDGSC